MALYRLEGSGYALVESAWSRISRPAPAAGTYVLVVWSPGNYYDTGTGYSVSVRIE